MNALPLTESSQILTESQANLDENKFAVARRLSAFAFHSRPSFQLSTRLHGIHIRWKVFSREFYHRLCSYFPACAIQAEQCASGPYDIEVTWVSPELQNEAHDLWLDADPNCRFRKNESELHVIQRDFIAVDRGDTILLMADYQLEDGLSNFIRWVLPQRLLQNDRVLLHSSAWKSKDGGVYICLGESGAGKTTAVSMVSKDLVLGDDMNLLQKVDGCWTVTPALVGQRIQSRDLLGTNCPIKGFMVLEKSSSNEIEPLEKSRAFLPLAAGFANLFWERMPLETVARAQNLMKSILSENVFFRLKFNLTGDVWDYVENR